MLYVCDYVETANISIDFHQPSLFIHTHKGEREMDSSSPEGVSIIDKDESSEKAYHVVEGFVIEDSKSPFPVSLSGGLLILIINPLILSCSKMVTYPLYQKTMEKKNHRQLRSCETTPTPHPLVRMELRVHHQYLPLMIFHLATASVNNVS